jgi:ketosteroid isomerase-like protein
MAIFGVVIAPALAKPVHIHAKPAQKIDAARIRNEINAMETAADEGDVNGSIAYIAPNFVEYGKRGNVECRGRAQYRRIVATMVSMARKMAIKGNVRRIKFGKNTAEVVETDSGTAQIMQNGQAHNIEYRSLVRTKWRRTKSGQWLETETHLIASKTESV